MKIIERAFPRSFVHTAYQMIFPFERNCDIGTPKEASISLLKITCSAIFSSIM